MAVRLQPCPLSRGPRKVNALSAGRSIQCWRRGAAQVQSGRARAEAGAMAVVVMGIQCRCASGAVVGCGGEGGRKCANGDAGDEAGDRWQWQHRAALRLVPKPHCLSLFNSGLALAALRFAPRYPCGPPPPPGRIVPCAMHTAAAEARVLHVSRLCLRCAVLSGPGVKRPGGEVALRPFAYTCHLNARGSTRYTAWPLAAEEADRKRSGSPSMRGSRS